MAKVFYSFSFDTDENATVISNSSIRNKYTELIVPLNSFELREDILEQEEVVRAYLKLNVDIFLDELIASIKKEREGHGDTYRPQT